MSFHIPRRARPCPESRGYLKACADKEPWDAFSEAPERLWQVWFLSHNPRFERYCLDTHWVLRPEDILETLKYM